MTTARLQMYPTDREEKTVELSEKQTHKHTLIVSAVHTWLGAEGVNRESFLVLVVNIEHNLPCFELQIRQSGQTGRATWQTKVFPLIPVFSVFSEKAILLRFTAGFPAME